ncbi:DUF4229 domain-containing protein [Mycobacterium sp.]|uniref:DUF4229 domain-containing protein n=1 Tax=Mycobacterium sp. TaxID=1785 RepID=UPI0031E1BEAC
MPDGRGSTPRAVGDVALYAAARLALVVLLSGVIYGTARLLGVREFPVVVAVLFALIIGMPLGIWLLAPLRRRATATLEQAGARRRRDREQLRARLSGAAPSVEPSSDEPSPDEPSPDEPSPAEPPSDEQ